MSRIAASRPHILFVNEFYWPDVCASSAVLSDHVPRLAALRPDWRISVLTGDRAWDRPEVTWPAREEHRGIEVHRVPRGAVRRTLLSRGLGFVRFHRAAIRRGRRIDRPDLVVASTAPPLGARIGRAIARHHRSRLIYRVLDLYPDCAEVLGVIRRGGWIARLWRAVDTACMRESAAIVTIGRRMAERIVATRGLESARVAYIPDGFDPGRLGGAAPDDFRREHGLGDRFLVQYAGNMGLSHPFETILEAVRLLAHEPDIAFQFIGAGPGRTRIEAAVAEGKLPVQILDYQAAERLGDVLTAADVGLIVQEASVFDMALPYKVYGILAAGRPGVFVGSAESEIAEWYRAARCGVQVDQGDAEGLARAIRRLKSSPEEAREMGRRGRGLLDERFTSRAAVTRWANLIEHVLGDRDSPPAVTGRRA